MLPARSQIQISKTLNPNDEKNFSTYQDEYNTGITHGNLVNHYGNSAYLDRKPGISYTELESKPFLSPSYHNLNSNSCIVNKFSDNYSNNYITSDQNTLYRPLYEGHQRTKLEHLFKVKTHPIANSDLASVYEHDFFHARVNDHFMSKKLLKTDTINLRDNLACLMELADFMRNKSFDVNSRNLFKTDYNGQNDLEKCANRLSVLMSLMEEILRSFDKLKSSGFELKKMKENFIFAENIIDRNIWDRKLKPTYERNDYNNIEISIKKDRKVLEEQKDACNKSLIETHILMNLIESFILKNLNQLIEEARIILMKKFHRNDYEKTYLRDSNGYIKQNPKLSMKVSSWLNLADSSIKSLEDFIKQAEIKNERLNELIKRVSLNLSTQWIETHDKGIQQIENGLKYQGKLVRSQYDLNQEIDQISTAIYDSKLKMNTCKMLDDVYLTQLRTPISKIDPEYDSNRNKKIEYANKVWSNYNDFKFNVNNMTEYKKELLDRKQRLDTNLKSNHAGLNYDLKTIVDPRRYTVGSQPSIGLVKRALTAFE